MTALSLSRVLGAAFVALALAAPLPVFAIDTGGEDTTPAPAATTTKAAPKPVKVIGPTLADARADIAAKNWTKAIADLTVIVKASPSSADAFNLLGYSYRNAGNYPRAGQAYAKALKLDPKHTGALEYQGVLFIKLNQIDKAKANLALIKTICGNTTCEAYVDLAKAIG
jgi:cytochrome c-type biogenesis protein CcmH/NrfG